MKYYGYFDNYCHQHAYFLDYEEGDGTPSYPYKDFNSALENVDELCRTVMIAPGTHEVASAILSTYVEIKGAGQYPDDTVLIQSSERPLRILMIKFSALVNMSNLTMFGVNTSYEGGGVMVKANGTLNGVSSLEPSQLSLSATQSSDTNTILSEG